MNLLSRYLQAVARLLPTSGRGDIIDELRANILSQLEDREQHLRRALTEEEQAEILRHHGNPTVVAGRYREDNLGLAFGRQLIGPELFPFYKTSVTVNLVITIVVLAGLLPAIAHSTGGAITLTRALIPLVTQFVIVTLIFIALDRNKGQVLDKWDPRKLPAVKANRDDGPTAANIFAFIVTAMGTLWLALTPHWPYLMLGPGALYVPQLGLHFWPQWPAFYWAIVALLCAQLVLQFLILFRWLPRPKARLMNVILRTMGLGIGVLLLMRAPDYVTSPYPEALYVPQLGLLFWPQWPAFYWAIVALLCAQLGLRFFTLFRWLPRPNARVMNVILRTIGLGIGVLLLTRAPDYVTSPYPEVAYWANLNFEVCIGIWMAVALWRTGYILFSLVRERHQMLPARQH